MNRFLLFGMCFFLLLGCTNEKDLLENELNEIIVHYIKESSKEKGDDLIIESVSILKIDTATAKFDSIAVHSKLLTITDLYLEELNIKRAKTDLTIQQAKTWKLMDEDLFEMYAKEAEELLQQDKESLEFVKLLNQQSKAMRDHIISGEIDSIQPTGYLVTFNVKARDSKNVAQDINSLTLLFDLDKRIKKHKYDDFIETPY